jgi:hypothetical protein
MANIKLTYQLAHAAGMDAANRNMHANGRQVWNEEDYSIAAATLNGLLPDQNTGRISDTRTPAAK